MNGADTAWILTSTALVLFMTLPGLSLFYAGLVRARNVLSVLMHCFAIACLVSIIWLVVAYSLAFASGGAANPVIGGLTRMFLASVGPDTLSGTIPESVFFMFQMTFAIITTALIVGAYPERIRFPFVLVFSGVWVIVVYAPIAHWVWGGGWLGTLGVMDFAGGIVVHISAGVSAIVIASQLGPRRGFPDELRLPHSPGLTMAGAAMLWVGWFGFNAGSALAADGNAGMAMTATHIAAAAGSLAWAGMEWIRFGKATLVGIVTGMVAGLATITPASGFVGPFGALVVGLAGGLACQWATGLIKQRLKIDDSLDVFAVHGVGGALGTILVGVFVLEGLGGVGLGEGITFGRQFGVQILGVIAGVVWAAVVTYVIVKVVGLFAPMRVGEEDEIEGLDIVMHGERGYDL
ncbi:MAG: ammonium transporter [Alphaproteobacteria bacterium]